MQWTLNKFINNLEKKPENDAEKTRKYINKDILKGQNGGKRSAQDRIDGRPWKEPRRTNRSSRSPIEKSKEISTQNRFSKL